jgi:hypothetical protein
VWAKGQPPVLGTGHQVSSILTTPTRLYNCKICGIIVEPSRKAWFIFMIGGAALDHNL